jgi:glyoxylase I family protein
MIQRTADGVTFLKISRVHHAAVICSDYAKSKRFYTEVLCLPIISEIYREDRGSHKLDLALPDGAQIELFSFPPARVTLRLR